MPQAFLEAANRRLAPGSQAHPSRLIVEVKNPTDSRIATYFEQHHYQTEGNGLDDGKAGYFLRLLTGIVLAVGTVICLLSFYLLSLSIFLLVQKNASKLENLLLLGYSPSQVALPYQLLAAGLNAVSLLAAIGCVAGLRTVYMDSVRLIFPQLENSAMLPCLLTGALLFVLTAVLDTWLIRRKVRRL